MFEVLEAEAPARPAFAKQGPAAREFYTEVVTVYHDV